MQKVTFKTRLSKGADAHTTAAEIDWAGVTSEQLQSLAQRAVIIAAQAVYRISGKIPATDKINVLELLQRERGAVKLDTPEARAAAFVRLTNKMSPAELAAVQNQMERK